MPAALQNETKESNKLILLDENGGGEILGEIVKSDNDLISSQANDSSENQKPQ